MPSYKPRYYQSEALNKATNYMKNRGLAGLAVLPTGTGKSHIIADLIQKLFTHQNKHKILMVTHVKELIEQNFEKLKLHWEEPPGRPPAGINSAGLGSRQHTQPIIYAGIQSIYKDAKKFGFVTVLIIDECHLLSDKSTGMYRTFIEGLKAENPDLRIIGFTATPYRMDMGHLCSGDTFDDVFYDISSGENFVKLINEGFLSNLKGIQPKQELDLSQVEKTKNEFKDSSLDKFVNRSEITKKIVAETIQWAQTRKKGLAFCVSKSHAEDMAKRFNEAGMSATFVHSDLSADQRAERLSDFKNGHYSLITNVGVLTTGFDAPDIDFIVMARPTRSPSLHVQMLGRGMRPHENKTDCLVLDYGGNIKRLGFVNEVSLPEQSTTGSDVAKVKSCKNCKSLIAISARVCQFCNFEISTQSPEIIPNSHVHIGDVISENNKKLKPKRQKANVEKDKSLYLNISYEDRNFTIFNVTKNSDHNNIIAIIFMSNENYRRFIRKKNKGLVTARKIGADATKRRYKTIPNLKQFLVKHCGENAIKLLEKSYELEQVWSQLLRFSGLELIKIFQEYEMYRRNLTKNNQKIKKTRDDAFTRFFNNVFNFKQAVCPVDREQSGCLFEMRKSGLFLCHSCGKVLNTNRVHLGFSVRYPTQKIDSFPNFFKANYLDND